MTLPSPAEGGTAFEHTFGEEVEGSQEYVVALWSRWLTTYPRRLPVKQLYHSLFRLSDRQGYQDASAPGDRVLSAFVARGSYLFSTYDQKSENPAVNQ